MDHDRLAGQATWPQRLGMLAVNLLVFNLCYLMANHLAWKNQVTRHLAWAFEDRIPFIEWMIVPYLSSGLFYAICFLRAQTSEQLGLLSRRMLLATVAASVVFVLYPLICQRMQPPIESPLAGWLFSWLAWVDRPYNQLPSLHVAYCVVFYASLGPSLRRVWARVALAGGLLLVAASTVLVGRHQVLDVVAGAMLGWLVIRVIASWPRRHVVAFHYGLAAVLVWLVGIGLGHGQGAGTGSGGDAGLKPQWLAWYLAVSLGLVALAYARRDRAFLRKRDRRHPWWIWCLYGPYLVGYLLTWYGVRYRERGRPAFVQVASRIWIGRRLTEAQARMLPAGCLIVDLAAELAEAPGLRDHPYHHVPLLDLDAPMEQDLARIAAILDDARAAGQQVFVHCAMGYERCRWVVAHWLRTRELEPMELR